MSEPIYCEFCGKQAGQCDNAKKLIAWIHDVAKNVVRCNAHRRASKMAKSCYTRDPLTGEKVGGPQ